ncbi:MAG: hypothetical protein GQ557_00250 [Mycoplasmataceae bacterium]|nr:hypothetical protein [Mycoplasmataceae bacterium]
MATKNLQKKSNKRAFKMPSSLSLIIIILFIIIIFSWILDWTNATTSFIDQNGTQQTQEVQALGLLSFGNSISKGFTNASSLILYLLVLSAYIEIIMYTGVLETGITALIKKLNGKEILIIPILFVFFSLCGTITGMQEGTIGFFLLVVPFLILAGFDAMTGLLVILLGTTTGFTASIVNPFSVGISIDLINNNVLDSTNLQLTMEQGIMMRIAIWILFTTIGVIFVTLYAHKVKKNPNNSVVRDDYQKNKDWAQQHLNTSMSNQYKKMTKREMIGLGLFFLAFFILIFNSIPWGEFFPKYDTYVTNHQYTYFPNYISWLFNGMNYPGYWSLGDYITEFILFSLAIGFLLRMNLKDITTSMWIGAKAILPIAIIIGVAGAIPVSLSYSNLDFFIVGLVIPEQANVTLFMFLLITFFIFIFLACFIPSTSSLATISMPLIALISLQIFGTQGYSEVDQLKILSYLIIVFTIATGLINMFIPTQVVVLSSCEASQVPYSKMLKPVLLYISILFLTTILFIIPGITLWFKL